jgi:CheY-like chemotaxis protein
MASAAAPECVRSAPPAAEDETFVCEVTCDLLRHSGYRVLHAENAADARRIFSRHFDEIDLLLCDAILPDENGLSLAHCLRQRSPRLKVIVASGYPRSELDRKIDIDACTQFLTKPFTSATLISRIRMRSCSPCIASSLLHSPAAFAPSSTRRPRAALLIGVRGDGKSGVSMLLHVRGSRETVCSAQRG